MWTRVPSWTSKQWTTLVGCSQTCSYRLTREGTTTKVPAMKKTKAKEVLLSLVRTSWIATWRLLTTLRSLYPSLITYFNSEKWKEVTILRWEMLYSTIRTKFKRKMCWQLTEKPVKRRGTWFIPTSMMWARSQPSRRITMKMTKSSCCRGQAWQGLRAWTLMLLKQLSGAILTTCWVLSNNTLINNNTSIPWVQILWLHLTSSMELVEQRGWEGINFGIGKPSFERLFAESL